MIRLLTASTINGAYLNFMGNEFGHPEWIDFPRQGNGWSYKYARRQWNLRDNDRLCYEYLGLFDEEMIHLVSSVRGFQKKAIQPVCQNDGDQVLAYLRGDLLFVFNFSPTRSFTDYGLLVPRGTYHEVLDTDCTRFGGQGLVDTSVNHYTCPDPLYRRERKEWLKLYLPARTAMVLKRTPAPAD
jgi:1,4-alpha-glucan branching enzyme